MSSTQKYAAIDLGAESGRVLTGLFDGKKLQLEEAHRFPNTPVRAGTLSGSALHWDVLRLWNDIQEGLSKARAAHGELNGIGVDTWGVDFGLLDVEGQLLGNPVHYRDARNDGMMEKAFETVPRAELFRRTGLQFMPFNSLYQLLALKTAGSPQLEIAKSLLFMPDLLNYWLTGTRAAEYTIASTSQMLDAHKRSWDEGLLSKLGLPSKILPNIIAPGTVIGSLRDEVAAATGLDKSTRVIAPGCHDTASAVAAVPFERANGAYLSSGTWSLMGIELEEPLINDRVAELNFTNEGGVGGKIRFLKNIAGLWLVQECRRTWLREGHEYSYAELTELASQAQGFGAVIEPDDAAFTAPRSMPKAIEDYCGKTGQQTPATGGEFVRTCLESLALKYRWTLEKLEELRGERLEVLHIVGGGTQNKLLSQLTADAIGRPVVAGPVEATAAGNILTQAMARGELNGLDQVRAVVRDSFTVETYEPRSELAAQWDDCYEKFLGLPR
jgi:rhamnulokinase